MPRFFYQRLALTNLKNNRLTYQAYLTTCTVMIALFYILTAISSTPALDRIGGAAQLKTLLFLGLIVMAIFAAVFLLYTNSFLIKRRTKELGLFNILGMEKRHLAKIMFWETVFSALICLGLGLMGGLVFTRLMFLLLLKLISFEVVLTFQFSPVPLQICLLFFVPIFLVSLLYNLARVQLAKPINLLRAEQFGEREPKTRWLLTLIGFASLTSGYYLAQKVTAPLEALNAFFVAVLLVMLGTYCLFTTGSVAVLKLLKRSKKYYYRRGNFTAIAGLMFRMKENAVGLANVCILSTAVLVTLSTTVSLYLGVEDQLRAHFPRQIEVRAAAAEGEIMRRRIAPILEDSAGAIHSVADYRSLVVPITRQESEFTVNREYLDDFSGRLGFMIFLPQQDYAKMVGKTPGLGQGQVLVLSRTEYPFTKLSVLGSTFTVADQALAAIPGQAHLFLDSYISSYYYVVVEDMGVMEKLLLAQRQALQEKASEFSYYLGFDLNGTDADELALYTDIRAALTGLSCTVSSRAAERDTFYQLYGGLFFVGIFLGALFLMGTVLIIYYKQITEGFADQKRFTIMQQVGMGAEEVRKTIRSQVRIVFFIPLTAAGIHILFAFKMVAKMLAVFNLTNTALFAVSTLGIFLIFALGYLFVYTSTAKVYYKIVRI